MQYTKINAVIHYKINSYKMISTKKISTSKTFPIRQIVLRKGKPIETCYFNGDNDATTTHFGVFQEEKILGVVSVYKVDSPLFHENNQFQIRGMALLSEHQGKGFGAQLLNTAEKYCWENQANLIWFNARAKAVSFYERSGYEIMGNSFEIIDVGTHFVMHKKS